MAPDETLEFIQTFDSVNFTRKKKFNQGSEEVVPKIEDYLVEKLFFQRVVIIR